MRIGTGKTTYKWIDNWIRIPDTETGRASGRTHSAAVTQDGRIIVFHQADPAVLIFNADGQLEHSWGDQFLGAHGLTLVNEGGVEYLWLTDQKSSEVAKTTLDGQTVLNIQPPALPIYEEGKFIPTWVAVNEERFGGNGDIWVADGYGMSYIHRYDKTGRYLSSINGEEGEAGAFKCPHGLWIDHRHADAELYIADRGNQRIQVYDLNGKFKRAFGSDFLTSPCCFVTYGDMLLIPELRARLTILDGDDKLVGYLGSNESVCDVDGWPNLPAALIQPGKFNSPHGIAVDDSGNVFVTEWIIGGRVTKLVPDAH